MPYNSRQRRALIILLVCSALFAAVLYSTSTARKRKSAIARLHNKKREVSKWLYSHVPPVKKTPCDVECIEFRRVMKSWPPGRPKAAIYYLAAGRGAIKPLRRSIDSLQYYFNAPYKYPIIVFIDTALNDSESREAIHFIESTESRETRTIYVQLVDFRLSPAAAGAPNNSVRGFGSVEERYNLAISLTDWFHVVGVYQQPVMHTPGLRYIMHMTGKRVLTSPVKFDPFQFMHDHKLLYGFQKLKRSSSLVDVGLWNTVQRYVTARKVHAPLFHVWNSKKEKRHFTTEFEVYSLDIWMSSAFREYTGYIERYGAFSRRKWRASSIRTIGVTLLVKQRSQLHQFNFTDIALQRADIIPGSPKPIAASILDSELVQSADA